MTHRYRYVFCDLLTDHVIDVYELTGVSFDRRILQAGTFAANIPITSRSMADKAAKVVPRHSSEIQSGPGRVVVHVYRDTDIWGTYLIWSARPSSSNGKISIALQGSTLESYLNRVTIRSDLTYAGTDQIDIARALLTDVASDPAADIGLELDPGTSGRVRDRTYLASETTSYGQRLTELAEVEDGFEWMITTYGDDVRHRRWTWGYPYLGNPATTHVFTEPGEIIDWSEDIDATRGATSFQTRGDQVGDDASDDTEPLTSGVVSAGEHLAAGWPRLDMTQDYSSVRLKPTLDDYARWWAARYAGTVRVHAATVRLGDQPSFTPNRVGDHVRLIIRNDWWPVVDGAASFDHQWRAVGMEVSPATKDEPETARLIFEEL